MNKDRSLQVLAITVLFFGFLGYFYKGTNGALELGSLALVVSVFVLILQHGLGK